MYKKIDWTRRNQEERDYYNYYRSLGYDEQTAVVLALFTYGQHRTANIDMDTRYRMIPGLWLEKVNRHALILSNIYRGCVLLHAFFFARFNARFRIDSVTAQLCEIGVTAPQCEIDAKARRREACVTAVRSVRRPCICPVSKSGSEAGSKI